MAWHPLGMRATWYAEIEPFPSAVLAHHYPNTPNLGDMTRLSAQVLAGDDDPLIQLVNMRLMAKLIPNSELHVIEDGHLFLITQAKAVAPIVMSFLSGAKEPAGIADRLCAI